jgi:hypothetical protein
MPHAKHLQSLYGMRTIFLATDDDAVLNETRAFPEFKFVYQKDGYRTPTAAGHWSDGKGTKRQKITAVLVDLFLLADSAALVGKFSSSVDRTAYALMTAKRGGCHLPFFSLDWKWCMDSAMPSTSGKGRGAHC